MAVIIFLNMTTKLKLSQNLFMMLITINIGFSHLGVALQCC